MKWNFCLFEPDVEFEGDRLDYRALGDDVVARHRLVQGGSSQLQLAQREVHFVEDAIYKS